ncbi:MAG TPA: nuclear transport factor 2 family protein [Roseiarcus sp.]|nr:nuclear transport factor 2 family protein [Roseiarcus sp.]
MKVSLSACAKPMMLSVLAVAFVCGEAVAQQSSDVEKVKAASQAFYAALDARDPSAMAKVYAHTPYVVHIDPTAKEIALGWEAVNKSWENVHDGTTQINVSFSETGQPQVVGNLAWEVGAEKGPVTLKDGKVINIDAFATNIYQKIDGSWLMVSHQAGQIPK